MDLTKIVAVLYLGLFVLIFVFAPPLVRLLRRRWQVGGAQLLRISKQAPQPEFANTRQKYACDHSHIPEIVAACSCCKKVRDEDGVWYPWEEYLHKHGVQISHGMCRECGDTLYPWRKDKKEAV